MDDWAADLASRQRLCDVVRECNLLGKPPSPDANRETWLTWAQGTEDKVMPKGFVAGIDFGCSVLLSSPGA
jgi:hypothetical protein